MWIYMIIAALFIAFLLYYHFSTKGPVMTGWATVVSRRMTTAKIASPWSDNYNRRMTFRFSDGSELELHVTKEVYALLKDGESYQLIWQGDQLICHDRG